MQRRSVFSVAAILALVLWVLVGSALQGPRAAEQDIDADVQRCSDEAAGPDDRIKACTRLLEAGKLADERLSRTRYNRGNAYYDAGDYERAIADYDEAIRSGFDAPDVFANRGDAYRRTGRYDLAIEDFNRVLRANPDDPNTYINRGLANEGLGQSERALDDYSQAIRLEPDSALAHYNRGLAYGRIRQYVRAIQDFDEAVRLDSGNAGAYYNRGLAYGRIRQYERAIRDFDEAIRLNPNDADAYHGRGLAYRYLGQYARAVADYGRSIQLGPSQALAYNSLAWLHATAKENRYRNADEAVRLARKAVEIESRNATYYDTLAAAYVEAGDGQNALATYRLAMALGGEQRVKSYQDYLKKKGFYAGAVDGLNGPATEAAFRACIEAGCKLLSD